MIAAFLKKDDGDFNYPAALVSVFFFFLISWDITHLCKALKTDRILFGVTYVSRVRWIERKNNPMGFWTALTIHCLGLLLCCSLIIVICFGLLRN
jgi:GT2 family glycosyltransferase